MSLTAAAMRLLAAKGLTLDEVIAVAEANTECLPEETPADRRRRADRERKRLARSGQSADIPQTNADRPEDAMSANSADIPQISADNCGHPRARVEDNPLRLVLTRNPISSFSDDDWPKDELHGFAKRLAMMAGPGLGDPAKEPGLTTTSPEIIRWRQMGCSWSLDVVPTIQARTLKARDRPITGWNLLTRDVLAAKARRERPVEPPNIGGGGQFMSAGQHAAAMRQAGVENLLKKLEAE